jgi:hypothetical protein
MSVLDELLNSLTDDAPVRDIAFGGRFTAVLSRSCGLASGLGTDCPGPEALLLGQPLAHVAGRTARELAVLARSENLREAGLGVAAINSLLEVDEARCVEVNAADIIAAEAKGRKVAVIGHFPFTLRLQGIAAELSVLELRPQPGDLPAVQAPAVLPQADVVAMSATTLINHTLDQLLALCSPNSYKMMLGPTTPLSPVLFGAGFDALSGIRVIDVEGAMHAVRAGASFPEIKRHCRLVTMEGETCRTTP